MSKKNKRRQCPALGREITSQECGADRISRIACTADCPFNTFNEANYDALGEVEDTVIRKAQERLYSSMSYDRMTAFKDQVLGTADPDRIHYLHLREMYLEKDRDGRNFFDRWEAENWKGLNNDERTVILSQRQTRPALLEIQQVLNEVSVQAVDLLRPDSGPVVIVDRNTAQVARRFQTVCSWMYPAPHYMRSLGAGRLIGDTGPCSPLETVQEIARHLGGPDDLPGLEQWFWTEWLRFAEAHAAMLAARWEQSMDLVDAISGKAEYRVTGTESALHDLLVAHPDIEEVPPESRDREEGFDRVYTIVEPPGVAEPVVPGLRIFTGTLRMGGGRLRADATSAERFERLKRSLTDLAGGHLEFVRERVDDVAKQLAARTPRKFDMSLVPPRLLEQPQRLNIQMQRGPWAESPEEKRAAELDSFQKMLDALPDTSIPALNGLTPREAAADPALRPALLRLMKGHVTSTDDFRQRRGFDLKINHVLEELGLHEINFPPVPLPEVPEDEAAELEDSEYADELEVNEYAGGEDGDGEDDEDENRWEPLDEEVFSDIPESVQQEWLMASPVLAPLSASEAERAHKAAMRSTMEEEGEWLQTNWPELCGFLDIEEPFLSLDSVEALVMNGVALAARTLFPNASRDGDLNFERLEFYWTTEARVINQAVASEHWQDLQNALIDGPQPELMSLITGQVMSLVEQTPDLLSPFEARKLLPLFKAILRELSLLKPD